MPSSKPSQAVDLVTLAALLAGIVAVEASRPAAAQGGIVGAYGPASYRACGKQSYAPNPKMEAGARTISTPA